MMHQFVVINGVLCEAAQRPYYDAFYGFYACRRIL